MKNIINLILTIMLFFYISTCAEAEYVKEVQPEQTKKDTETEDAFNYFSEKLNSNQLLDLRQEQNQKLFKISFFNQYDNPTSSNKYILKNQFEYNREKESYKNLRNIKYHFVESRIEISEYDFKLLSYEIKKIISNFEFPNYEVRFKSINMAGNDIVDGYYELSGTYILKSKPKIPVDIEQAESLSDGISNNKTRQFLILEIAKINDKNFGINCSNLRKSLFEGRGSDENVNYYIKPTCISEKWNTIIIRNIEVKIVGYYIIYGDTIYKWIETKK